MMVKSNSCTDDDEGAYTSESLIAVTLIYVLAIHHTGKIIKSKASGKAKTFLAAHPIAHMR